MTSPACPGDRVLALPVVAVRRSWPDSAIHALAHAVHTFCGGDVPMQLSLVLELGGGRAPAAHYVIETLDPAALASLIRHYRRSTAVAVPWLVLGDPCWIERPSPAAHEAVYRLVPAMAGERMVSLRHSALRALADDAERTVIRVTVSGHVSDDASDAAVEVQVWSTGWQASLAARTLAAEHAAVEALDAVPLMASRPAPVLMGPSQAATLLSLPLRLSACWPEHPRLPNDGVRARFLSCNPPHALVLGGSGLGKTTLLTWIVDDVVRSGRPVFVVCMHGDAAYRAAQVVMRHGRRADVYDFGDATRPPHWNVCVPPTPGFADQWVGFLLATIRGLWPDTPEEYFGPVWRRAMRLALRVLCEDPSGPQPISRLLEILARDALPEDLADAIESIDDPELTKGITDVRRAIANDREGNYTSFLVSKLEPLLAHPALRKVVDHDESEVSFDDVVRGRSFIAAVPTATLGDEGALVIASTLLATVWQLMRSTPDAEELTIVLDELQRFPDELVLPLLAESRKFGVRVIAATQSLGNLSPRLTDAMLANCGAVATYRCGPRDAALLDAQFPSVTAGALQRLPSHTVAVTFGDDDLVSATDAPHVDDDPSVLRSMARATSERRPGLERLLTGGGC